MSLHLFSPTFIRLTLLALLLSIVPAASATSIDYDIDGRFGLRFTSTDGGTPFNIVFGQGADSAAEQYTFTLNTETGEATLSGKLQGFVTSSTNAKQKLSESPVLLDLALHYTGLSVGNDPVTGQEVIAIGRSGAEGSGTATILSSYLGGRIEVSLGDKFAFPKGSTTPHPVYGTLGFQPFNLLAGFLPSAGTDVFKTWVMSAAQVNVLSHKYNVGGDFHGTIKGQTEVPEPATAALLCAGLLGGMVRKRRGAGTVYGSAKQ